MIFAVIFCLKIRGGRCFLKPSILREIVYEVACFSCEMDDSLEDVLRDADVLSLNPSLPIGSPLMTSVTEEEAPNESPEKEPEIDESKLGHMCIVLSPQVRKQLMRGEPLIVGTSTASVEAFFHRLISVCQMGAHMPVMFQTLGGAVTVANIKKRKNGIINKAPVDRYPVPKVSIPVSSKRPRKLAPRKVQGESRTSLENEMLAAGVDPDSYVSDSEAAPGDPADNLSAIERDEIPLEAIRLYLREQKYFPGWQANAKRNLRKRCKDFSLSENDVLYYQSKKGPKLLCVEDRAERMNLIWETHVVDHRRRDGLLASLKDRFYWKGMFQDITRVLDTCEVCASQREMKAKMPSMVGPNDAPVPSSATGEDLPNSPPRKKAKKSTTAGAPKDADETEQVIVDTFPETS